VKNEVAMSWIDISLPISEKLTIWPGDPKVQFDWIEQIPANEVNLTRLCMSVHSGTHIDAPLHFFENGKSIDQIDLSEMIGEVHVIQVPEEVKVIDKSYLDTVYFEQTQRLIFKTRMWKNFEDRFDENFKAIDETGARWLVEQGIKLIGIDYLSISPYTNSAAPHQILLGAEIVVVEGLVLNDVKAGKYEMICLPINLAGREAAPARVILGKVQVISG